MRKRLSLQWKLTLTTALLVIIACLSLSYTISKSAIFYMGNIEDTVTTIFPEGLFLKILPEMLKYTWIPQKNSF